MDYPEKTVPACPFPKVFPSQLCRDDEHFMRHAYNNAIDAWNRNEVPIGAVVVIDGTIVGSGGNEVESTNDPTAHAEMIAITQASRRIADWRLNRATLYVTKEPCPMCSGAAIMARLGRVVIAVEDTKMGGLGGAFDVNSYPGMNHRIELEFGCLRDEALNLLQQFFRMKRGIAKGTI